LYFISFQPLKAVPLLTEETPSSAIAVVPEILLPPAQNVVPLVQLRNLLLPLIAVPPNKSKVVPSN
jgi:hypothetical protein